MIKKITAMVVMAIIMFATALNASDEVIEITLIKKDDGYVYIKDVEKLTSQTLVDKQIAVVKDIKTGECKDITENEKNIIKKDLLQIWLVKDGMTVLSKKGKKINDIVTAFETTAQCKSHISLN